MNEEARVAGLVDDERLACWMDTRGLPEMAAFGQVVLDMARRAAEPARSSKLTAAR